MKKILKEIQSGKFAKEWVAESEAGRANFNALRDAGARHQIEEVGAELRVDDAVPRRRQAEGQRRQRRLTTVPSEFVVRSTPRGGTFHLP